MNRRRAVLAGGLAFSCCGRPPRAANAPARPWQTVEVARGVFVHPGLQEDFTAANEGGIANLGFIIGDKAVAVIDSGGSAVEGRDFLAAIRRRTALPIRYVVNTHVHPDHLFGNAAFAPTGAVFVGHVNLARHLAEAGPSYLQSMKRLLGPAADGIELVPPSLTVGDRLSLDLGGRRIELRAWPTAHTDTDLTLLDVATGTLFAGDLVFLERLPVVDGSLLGWLRVLDRLAAMPSDRVVPGHGPASSPWPQALDPERAYLMGLRDAVRAALARNETLEQAVGGIPVSQGQHWLLAAENHPRNITAAFTELEWE